MKHPTLASPRAQQEDLLFLLARSRRLRPSLPFPATLRRSISIIQSKDYKTLVRDYEIISHSPLFDPAWYTETYKNVEEQREDPIHHFLKYGGPYNLSPGPHFDTKNYFAKYPDVRNSGENPLLHFIRTCAGLSVQNKIVDQVSPSVHQDHNSIDAPITTDPYVAWIAAREVDSSWATGQAGPKLSFLVVPRPDDLAALSNTLVSLNELNGDGWEAIVASDDSVVPGAMSPIKWISVRSDQRGTMLANLVAAAQGEFIAVLDAGDCLSPHALQEIWQCLQSSPHLDLLYSDEDIFTQGRRGKPFLKPAWSPEYLDSFNYFGHLTCIRRSIVIAAGSFSENFDDAAEYDLNLRVCERTGNIGRIARILCHRSPVTASRCIAVDGPAGVDHRRALEAAWGRRGVQATVTFQPNGTLRSTWPLSGPPLVSVIIPNKNKSELLRFALDGLLKQTDYPHIEIVIVDNLSTEPALAALYAEVEIDDRVRVVSFAEPFNYSAACNFGARYANGSVLLFLNNDIEVTTPDWLTELVRYVERPGVGIAGTMLVFPNGELQHAGVVVGMHDGYGLLFRAADPDEWGVFGSPSVPRNYLGIMGACQMIRRDVFDRVGGFDETYKIANSDIALSIAAWQAGYRTVYTPYAKLIHHEGASRGHTNPTEDYARTSRDLDTFGILEDPYFHPELSSHHPTPTLRRDSDFCGSENLARQRAKHLLAYPEPAGLDVFDTADVILALGRDEAQAIFWAPQPPSDIVDIWSAMRFVVDTIRNNKDVQVSFPKALSGGVGGAFSEWILAGEGRRRFGISEPAAAAVRLAFDSMPSDQVRRAYLFSDDIRSRMPLGCTPAGFRELFVWLMRQGRREHELRIEAIWWFALECAERPAQEFAWAYLFNPVWQQTYPDGLTVFGREAFARWIRIMYRTGGDWLDPSQWPQLGAEVQIRLAYHHRELWQRLHPDAFASQADALALLEWLASDASHIDDAARTWLRALDWTAVAADLAKAGANVLAHFRYPSGLRTSAESLIQGLHEAGCGTSLRDIWVEARRDDADHIAFDGLELFDTTIIHTQPEPFFSDSYRRGGLFERRPKTYRVAYWYWELDEIPATWLEKAEEIDEFWVATRFVGDAMRARFDKPVYEFLPGLELPPFRPLPRHHFRLAEDRFTFLFVFHMMSIMERKNPLGLIRAFRVAFGNRPEPLLVIKTSFGDRQPDLLRQLKEAAAGEGIEVIDAIYSPQETLSIIDACDCYVSLHRSEGYGLTMAEAMLLGKPVIATAYSGNLDFMDDSNSLLVEKSIVTLDREYPPYAEGARWAEPSTEHAASCMLRVFKNQAWAKALGTKAKSDLTTRLSYAACGAQMADRLTEIDRMRREPHQAKLIRFLPGSRT